MCFACHPKQFTMGRCVTEFSHNPVGKQRMHPPRRPSGIFYTANSGIWQTVWLEPVSETSTFSYRSLSPLPHPLQLLPSPPAFSAPPSLLFCLHQYFSMCGFTFPPCMVRHARSETMVICSELACVCPCLHACAFGIPIFADSLWSNCCNQMATTLLPYPIVLVVQHLWSQAHLVTEKGCQTPGQTDALVGLHL